MSSVFDSFDPMPSLASMNTDPPDLSPVPVSSSAPPPPRPGARRSGPPAAAMDPPNPDDEALQVLRDREKIEQGKIDTAEGNLDKTIQGGQELGRQRADELTGREHELDATTANLPQDNIKFVMQQSPLFLGLAALAGSAFKSGAVTGLGAMNGAVQGMLKGDRQAYDDAMVKYQSALNEMLAKFKLRDERYEALKENFGLSLEGDKLAWQRANSALMMDMKESDRIYAHKDSVSKILASIQMNDARIRASMRNTDVKAGATVDAAAVRAGSTGGGSGLLNQIRDEKLLRMNVEDLDKRIASDNAALRVLQAKQSSLTKLSPDEEKQFGMLQKDIADASATRRLASDSIVKEKNGQLKVGDMSSDANGTAVEYMGKGLWSADTPKAQAETAKNQAFKEGQTAGSTEGSTGTDSDEPDALLAPDPNDALLYAK